MNYLPQARLEPNLNQLKKTDEQSIKKIVEQLVPSQIQNILNEKDHFFDLYLTNKKYLTYDENNSMIAPNLMKDPYSNFSAYFGKLNHHEMIKTDLANEVQTQVSVQTNEQNTKFILKKFLIYFNPVI